MYEHHLLTEQHLLFFSLSTIRSEHNIHQFSINYCLFVIRAMRGAGVIIRTYLPLMHSHLEVSLSLSPNLLYMFVDFWKKEGLKKTHMGTERACILTLDPESNLGPSYGSQIILTGSKQN